MGLIFENEEETVGIVVNKHIEINQPNRNSHVVLTKRQLEEIYNYAMPLFKNKETRSK